LIGKTASNSVLHTAVRWSNTLRHKQQFATSANKPLAAATLRNSAMDGSHHRCSNSRGTK